MKIITGKRIVYLTISIALSFCLEACGSSGWDDRSLVQESQMQTETTEVPGSMGLAGSAEPAGSAELTGSAPADNETDQEWLRQEQRRAELASVLRDKLFMEGSEEEKTAFVEWLMDTYEFDLLEAMDLSEDLGRQLYTATGKSLHVLWDTSLGYLEDEDTAAAHSIYLKNTKDAMVDIAFAGDICLTEDGYVIDHYDAVGGDINLCLSKEVMNRLNEADISMINHEYPVSTRGTALKGKTYIFRAAPEREVILQQMGIDIVSLANNHIYDFGADAFYDTLEILQQIKMPYVGAGKNLEEASRPVYFVVDGIKIGFLAANRSEKFIFTPEAGEDSPGVVRMYDTAMMNEMIREASGQCDYLIAYVHWGTENSKYYEAYQTDIAREFFASGADAIIGGHSHVLQGIGYVDGKPVVYSLGDFWFNGRTKFTTIATLKVTVDGLAELSVLPCRQEGYETHYISDEAGQKAFYDYLRELSPDVSIDDNGIVMEKYCG